MSVHQTYIIRCDVCGKQFTLIDQPEIPKRANEIRAIAVGLGWVYQPVPPGVPRAYQGPVKSKDFCPPCGERQ